MTIRAIYLPGPERWVSLAAYVSAIRIAKANPTKTFKCGLTCWWPCTGAEIRAQFMRGLHERINQATPYIERGKP